MQELQDKLLQKDRKIASLEKKVQKLSEMVATGEFTAGGDG